jgi:hypothetical protein
MRPTRVVDEAIRMPLLRFDGVDDTMLFSARLTHIRTVFWVIRGDPASMTNYRFLLGDVSAYDFCSGSTSSIWDSYYTSASIRNGVTRVDGLQVNGVQTSRPTTLSVVSAVTTGNVIADAFSRDRSYGHSWWGDLAELVIYERALSIEEVRSVEVYLAGRYGIGLAP